MKRHVILLSFVIPACDRATPRTANEATQPAPAVAAPPAVAAADAAAPEQIPEPNRPLTAGEVALLKPIFQDGIDYTRVRVINNSFPFQPTNVYMTPRGHVYAPGNLWQDDFSTSHARAVFVHEMTHVWQHANGMDLVGQGVVEFTKYRGDYEKAYPYELDSSRDLTDYGMEQQASIVEDFYLITFRRQVPQRITNRGIQEQERDALYAAVLKLFVANPRYARDLDARKLAEQHAARSEQAKPGPQACKESEAEHGASHMCSWRFEQPQ